MDKLLKLYTYVDGGANDTPFPDADNPIEIGEFRYDAKRMGGAPTITASVYYPSCLDEVWTDNVYAEFNGEKYYLKQVPTSSYSNEDSRYKHDLELVSERGALDNVYFYDTVSDEAEGDDKPVSNSTKFVFHGDIHEFASRLGHSLAQSGLDYTVHVDTGVSSESLLISFENAFFSNAIQEAYNTYNIPYYFVGKEIHFGLAGNNIEEVLAYGVDDALLSITKSNANYKIVNRATGTGSSENIPFYYPNNSPKGNIIAETDNNFVATIVNHELYSNKVKIGGVIRKSNLGYSNLVPSHKGEEFYSGESFESEFKEGLRSAVFAFTFDAEDAGDLKITFNPSVVGFREQSKDTDTSARVEVRWQAMLLSSGANPERPHGNEILFLEGEAKHKGQSTVTIPIEQSGTGYIAVMNVSFTPIDKYANSVGAVVYKASFDLGSESGWVDEDGKSVTLVSLGLETDGREVVGDTITQRLVRYINTSDKLLPPIYRETNGAERFYNAINGEYTDENGDDIVFANPYIAGRPKEHIITVEDIKPTIKETTVGGLRIDMFSEFAYDEDDNDETYEDEEGNVYFKHPYFYGKLRVMDFNLFDHAIEQQPMTISFTSGDVGACNFEIGVTEDYPQKNPVQVDEDGNLVRDENGRIVAGVEGTQQLVTTFQDRQQDTSKYEVWIALRKEEETYGILMPQSLHRPKACSEGQNDGDTFVVLGINLPFSYIQNAEEKLEREIIKYIKENNEEKFKFSITFSRIYFEENPDVLALLNENSALKVSYNGRTYDSYVSSFSYSMSEGDALPEIRVELDDTLQVTQNALQNAISEVKSQIGSVAREVNSQMAMQRASYIQRQADDEAYGNINFTKGIKFGEGGKVEVLDNNSVKLTIEYLEVTKKATFTSLEIQEKTHAGGQILVTPAAMNCGEVEELEDAYRCYFQTKGAEGNDEIFNQFAVGDQAICQTFNAWGSTYYWRLVTAVGEDYIDLSKTDCDEGSGVPSAGDKIIQMGNRDDEARQNAIVIAAYGEGSPYIIQYKGINNYDLPTTDGEDDRIMTMLSPTKNILTGMVRMQAGSEGLENFAAWTELKEEVAGKVSAEDISGYEYLVQALQQPTEVLGGLILTSNIQLRDSDGIVRSGINGIYDANATGGGIAAWYGGAMSEGSAKTVLRFDGSGFFANKNITWDNEGGASFAGGKITITKEGALVFSDDIAFGSNEDETVSSIIEKLSTVLSYFSLEGNELTTNYQVRIKDNLIVEGDTSSGGEGEDVPAGGTVTGVKVNGVTYEPTAGIVTIPDYPTSLTWEAINGKPSFATVATSGKYSDLSGLPTIPSLDGYATEVYVRSQIAGIDLSPYATKTDVSTAIANLINGAPTTLDTLKEIADALAENEDVVEALEAAIGTKANASDVYTKSQIDTEFEDYETALATKAAKSDLTALTNKHNVLQDDFDVLESTVNSLQGTVSSHTTNIGTLQGYFSNGIAKKATADASGNVITTYYTSIATHNALATRVGTAETNITNLTKNKADKATTLSGYGITNAYTKTEIDTKVTTINNTISGVSGRVTTLETWKSDISKYITIVNGNVKISTNLIVTGDTSSGGSGEDTGAEGTVTGVLVGTTKYESVSAGLLNLTSLMALYTPVSTHNNLAGRVTALEGKATAVSFTQTLTSGTKIGTIKIDGVAKNIYTPTIPTAIKNPHALSWSGYSSGSYDGSAAKAITIPSNTNQLTNGAGFITGITKSMVDSVLGGTASSNANKFLMCTGSTTVWSAVTKSMVSTALGASTGGRYLIDTGGDVSWSAIPTKLSQFTDDVVSGKYLPISGGNLRGELIINPSNGTGSFSVFNSDDTYRLSHTWDGNTARLYNITSDGSSYGVLNLQGTIQVNGNTAIHSGNIGSYAVKIDGSSVMTGETGLKWGGGGNSDSDGFASALFVGLDTISSSSLATSKRRWSAVLNVGGTIISGYRFQLASFAGSTYNELYYRGYDNNNSKWKDWKTIAFIDSTVDKAKILVDANNAYLVYKTSAGNLYVGDNIYKSGDTHILGNNIKLRYGTSASYGFILNSSGNVTIGGSDLASTNYNLYVGGSSYIYASDAAYGTLGTRPSGATLIGYDKYGLHVWSRGNGSTIMQVGRADGTATAYNLVLQHLGGNVGIGTTSPAYKLDVAGTAYASYLKTSGISIECDADGVGGSNWGEINRFASSLYVQNRAGNLYLSHSAGTTYIRGLASITGAVTMSSTLSVGGNITPNANSSYTLGTSSYRWSTIYGTHGNFSASVTATTSVVTPLLQASGGLGIVANGSAAGSRLFLTSNCFRPWGDDSKLIDLGSSSVQWRNLYAVGATFSGEVLPSIDNGGQIGNSENRWAFIYAFDGYFSNMLSARYEIYSGGDIRADGNAIIAGDTSSGSDIRFKDIIKNKTLKIADIAKAPLFTFKWNDREDDNIHLGSSAQYWEKVCPWLVTGEDFKSLNYATLGVAMGISLAKKAVNHEARIKELERKVKSLEEENRRLRYGN